MNEFGHVNICKNRYNRSVKEKKETEKKGTFKLNSLNSSRSVGMDCSI